MRDKENGILCIEKTSQLTNRKGKKQSLHVRDKECDMLTDSDKLQLRSKQCIEELYNYMVRITSQCTRICT